MCGRFVNFRGYDGYKQHFPIDLALNHPTPNYNVAPTQPIPVIIKREGQYVLDLFQWGLIPFWAKDQRIGYKMINARSETAASKPSFRHAFKTRRCLILADGFYEWQQTEAGKQPLVITLPDGRPFAFAGLWETWRPKSGGPEETLHSCTILTTEACPALSGIHHRMPVILPPASYETWLDPDNHDTQALQILIENKANLEFTFRPVSPDINSTKNNSAENLVTCGNEIQIPLPLKME